MLPPILFESNGLLKKENTYKEMMTKMLAVTILLRHIFAIFHVKVVHCCDRVGATMKFATDNDKKSTNNFLLTKKQIFTQNLIHLHLGQIQ